MLPCRADRLAPAVFIAEITARAFIIADSNKRRTLSRADIAKAVSKSDQFDFLIDILPREEPFPGAAAAAGGASGSGAGKGKKARILKLIEQVPAKASGEQAEDLYMLIKKV